MDISIKDLFRILSKNFVIIVICAVIGFAGAFSIFKFIIKPTYVSSVKLYVYTIGDCSNAQT